MGFGERKNDGGGYVAGGICLALAGALGYSIFGGEGNDPAPQQPKVGLADFSCVGQNPDPISETQSIVPGDKIKVGSHTLILTKGRLDNADKPGHARKTVVIKERGAIFNGRISSQQKEGKTVWTFHGDAECAKK